MKILLSIALRNLLQGGRRTFFLTTAIGLVTMFLVILLAISQGITNTLIRSSTALSSGHVNVGGFYKITSGRSAPRILAGKEIKDIVRQHVPELDYMVDRQRGFGKVVGVSGSLTAGFHGLHIEEETRFKEVIRLAPESKYVDGGSEKVYGDVNRLSEPNTILLFATQAKRLGVKVGDIVTLSSETGRGSYNTVDCTVVAIAEDMGMLSDWSVFLPKRTVDYIYRSAEKSTGAVHIYLRDIDDSKKVMERLRTVLEGEGYRILDHLSAPFFMKFDIVDGEDWTGQKLDLTIWEDEVIMFTYFIDAFDALTVVLISILLVIIGVGIMNSMWIAVRERTSEVGTLRAIGMSRWRVLLMFLFESLFLGLLATFIGAGLGGLLAWGLDAATIKVPYRAFQIILLSDTLTLVVTPEQLLTGIFFLTVVTGISALFPAWRASRLSPITAIHQTG